MTTTAARLVCSTSLVEMRSHAPELAQLPDDILAKLLHRCGMGWWDWLGGYQSFATAKGVPLLDVLAAAADDDLGRIVCREA